MMHSSMLNTYQSNSFLIVEVLLTGLSTLHVILPNHTVCFKGLILTTNILEKSELQFTLKTLHLI